MAEASRSKSVPVVVRTSQPRPTVTAVRPGASLVSETLPPLDRLTAMLGVPSLGYGWCSAVEATVTTKNVEGGPRGSGSLYLFYRASFPPGGRTRPGNPGDADRPGPGTWDACPVLTSSAAPSRS